jgi:hypothetical protein
MSFLGANTESEGVTTWSAVRDVVTDISAMGNMD